MKTKEILKELEVLRKEFLKQGCDQFEYKFWKDIDFIDVIMQVNGRLHGVGFELSTVENLPFAVLYLLGGKIAPLKRLPKKKGNKFIRFVREDGYITFKKNGEETRVPKNKDKYMSNKLNK